jgi:glycosyltransferase involved in cell wall biosynthesis
MGSHDTGIARGAYLAGARKPAATKWEGILNVLLLRMMREQGVLSVDRIADMLEEHLSRREGLRVESRTVAVSKAAARLGFSTVDAYIARYVRYPLRLRRISADVFHIVDQSYAHLSRALPRERTVVTCNDVLLLRLAETPGVLPVDRRSLIQFRWITSHLKSVARVACISNATRNDVQRLCGVPSQRLTVIPLGVDHRFRPLPAERVRHINSRFGARKYRILHVSTGGGYKNVRGTLLVTAVLRGWGLNVSLMRAGKSLTAFERDLSESLGVLDSVIDHGPVSDDRLIELYNAADVLLFPSFHEGFGLPVLEAMACGLPVVTSETPALLEAGGGAALTAPADDTEALARAVRAVFEDPDLALRLRARGIKRAELFSWERTATAYAELYEEVFRESAT